MTLPETMAVIDITEPGGPEVLKPGERPVPMPGPGEVLIEVAFAGVNGPDLMQRKGLYPAPKGASDLLGLEISGTVVALGEGALAWSIGDRVCALTNGGGYAAYCAVDERHVLPAPEGWSMRHLAAVPETHFTIWSNVFMYGGLSEGQVYLVHGGAGGLGTTSIQLAKAVGATVVAVDGPAERLEICRTLGADTVVDYTAEDFVSVVRETYGGADVILDIVGGDTIAKNIKAAKPDGRIIQLAFAKGSKVEIDLMAVMLKRLVYTGSTLRSRSADNKAEIAASLSEVVWPMLTDGRVKPVETTVLPLAEAAGAHALMERAGHVGKIVLSVGGEPPA
jgi:NADPH2:quinone reductase